MLKRTILRALRAFGYDLVPSYRRCSLDGVLRTALNNRLSINSIIDVGAGRGDFTLLARSFFSQTPILMIEPLDEFRGRLTALQENEPLIKYVQGVAANIGGASSINVHPDLFGSSLLVEGAEIDVNGTPRTVPSFRLDSLVAEHGLVGGHLLKIDTQGAEQKVLEGAGAILSQCAMVIVETSFLPFFDGGPLFHALVSWMAERGFVIYDLFGLAYRPLDGALAQVDAVFVPEGCSLRKDHRFATPAQRAALTERLKAER